MSSNLKPIVMSAKICFVIRRVHLKLHPKLLLLSFHDTHIFAMACLQM